MTGFTAFPVMAVAAGGAIGSVLRYGVARGVNIAHPQSPHVATLLVNVLGSFLIGLLMARYVQQDVAGARLFLVTGILGGFTTFSAFSWDTLQLVQRGAMVQAALYVAASFILSLAAVAVGFQVGR